LPTVLRDSIAAWASAARSSGNRCPTTRVQPAGGGLGEGAFAERAQFLPAGGRDAHHRYPAGLGGFVRDLCPGTAGEPEHAHPPAAPQQGEGRRADLPADTVEDHLDLPADALGPGELRQLHEQAAHTPGCRLYEHAFPWPDRCHRHGSVSAVREQIHRRVERDAVGHLDQPWRVHGHPLRVAAGTAGARHHQLAHQLGVDPSPTALTTPRRRYPGSSEARGGELFGGCEGL
jgi:hypothetical protein